MAAEIRVPAGVTGTSDAEDAVRHVLGLCGVTTELVVSGPPVAAEAIQAEIERALERRAARAARWIQVVVRDGRVTLTGRVRSWDERWAVIGAASHAPGVQAVDDELWVTPVAEPLALGRQRSGSSSQRE